MEQCSGHNDGYIVSGEAKNVIHASRISTRLVLCNNGNLKLRHGSRRTRSDPKKDRYAISAWLTTMKKFLLAVADNTVDRDDRLRNDNMCANFIEQQFKAI